MSDIIKPTEEIIGFLESAAGSADRRSFLKWAGLGITLVVAAGCSDDATTSTTSDVTFTNDDFGVLNYAYALEQLEAAFYTKLVSAPPTGITAAELEILAQIRDHEIAHREFLKAALGAKKIQDLTPDFSSVANTRQAMLEAARTFEDLGVGAYNGAGKLLKDAGFLTIAGKIVSVEARHAATIRDILNPRTASFSGDDVVDPTNGTDQALSPTMVVAAAQKYVTQKLNVSNLPTT